MPLDVPRDEFQGRGKEVKMAGVPKISIKGLFTDQFRCIQFSKSCRYTSVY